MRMGSGGEYLIIKTLAYSAEELANRDQKKWHRRLDDAISKIKCITVLVKSFYFFFTTSTSQISVVSLPLPSTA